jgi:gliding motility-associated-like protein
MKRILSFLALLLLLSVSVLHAQNSENYSGALPKGEDESGVFIPNAFTPNGDGVNDIFYIPDANFTRFEFQVFDRWGNRVYFSDSPSFRWTGESAGKQVPSGIYVFVLSASNAKKADIRRSGNITIVR